MTAPHFFADDVSGDEITLGPEDSRHALRVLRLRAGEQVTIADGSGAVVDAVVGGRTDRLSARVTARRTEEHPRPSLHVLQAIPKKGKLDLVVQKLTELGVTSIRPFAGERSVPKWDADKRDTHTSRLREVARQAAMQSRRAWIPQVHPPVALDALALVRPALVRPALVLHESATMRLSAALPTDAPDDVTLVIGPEGGLTEAELTAFRDHGAAVVSLGDAILRTETAALAAVTVLLARYGLLG